MKKNIYLLLLLGLAVHQIKTNNYVSSVFWYCPASDLPNQLFFGAQSPSAMEGTYGQNMSSLVPFAGTNATSAVTIVNYLSAGSASWSANQGSFFTTGAWFNQALIGPYFSTWGSSELYITQPHSPKGGANAAQIRLLGLGIQDCTGSIVGPYYNNSYGMLKELVNNTLLYTAHSSDLPNYGDVAYFSDHVNAGFMLAWLNGNSKHVHGAEQYYINKNYNTAQNWKDLTASTIMTDGAVIFARSFANFRLNPFEPKPSDLFKEQIHISNSDFNPPLSNVSGLDATTYFKNNKNYTVYLRFNLITPSNMMRVTEHTDLYYATVYQNTYTHMYSQDGSSDCGDDYGF